jgi:DNA-binding transcriptional LysR family regulator
LGVSQSALSHTIRALEKRLGLRLLTRTTRSLSPTEAGERLLQTVAPRFDEIEAELAALGDMRDKPAGTIRISAAEHAANTVLWPKLVTFLPDYPGIKVEIIVNDGMIVSEPPAGLVGLRAAGRRAALPRQIIRCNRRWWS